MAQFEAAFAKIRKYAKGNDSKAALDGIREIIALKPTMPLALPADVAIVFRLVGLVPSCRMPPLAISLSS